MCELRICNSKTASLNGVVNSCSEVGTSASLHFILRIELVPLAIIFGSSHMLKTRNPFKNYLLQKEAVDCTWEGHGPSGNQMHSTFSYSVVVGLCACVTFLLVCECACIRIYTCMTTESITVL